MTDREQFEIWWESLPLTERIIACHPVDAASHFAHKGWQAARAAPAHKGVHDVAELYKDDNELVCPTCGQSHIEEAADELREKLARVAPAQLEGKK